MSVDFNAEFENNRPQLSIEQWPKLMENLGPATQAVIDKFRHLWRPQVWAAKAHRLPGFIDLVGPGGFSFTLSPVSAHMYHCGRFDTFVRDPQRQELLRKSCFEIATLLHSSRAIYFAELVPTAFFDGGDLNKSVVALQTVFGAPAPSISQIAERFEPGCYYVDTFEDLRGRS